MDNVNYFYETWLTCSKPGITLCESRIPEWLSDGEKEIWSDVFYFIY